MDKLKVKISRHHEDAQIPAYATSGSSGMDLYSVDSVTIQPFERALVQTGIRISLPIGYEAQVRPRSGLALKKGLTVLNSPGTIDQDYLGEIGVILYNSSQDVVVLNKGERIAQLVISPVAQCELVEFEDVRDETTTVRGEGGFGHTGVN